MISGPKIAMIMVLALAGCEGGDQIPTVAGRWYTPAQVEAGQLLYTIHCTVCHASNGGATADWRTPGADGHYPPPPLNGSAHTWHHSRAQLDSTIQNGGVASGGVMPAFAHFLDAQQRLSIIAYFQAWWTDEIYAKWAHIDARSR